MYWLINYKFAEVIWPSQKACIVSGPFVEIAVIINPKIENVIQIHKIISPNKTVHPLDTTHGLHKQVNPQNPISTARMEIQIKT